MYISDRDKAFLGWCCDGASRFVRCSKRQYMTIITNRDGRVVGTGYNGAPSGVKNCTDGGCPRAFTEVPKGSSYENCIAVHSEVNALLHSDVTQRQGGTLYVNGPPCFDCSKAIGGSGISRVVCIRDDGYAGWEKCRALLLQCGVQVFMVYRGDV